MKYGHGFLAAVLGVTSFSVVAEKAEPSLHPYLDRSHQFLIGAHIQDLHIEYDIEFSGPSLQLSYGF